MKKFWKGAVCVLLILLCVLGLVAKYDTNGFYWGMDKGRDMGYSHVGISTNSFGRTVYVYAIGQNGDLNRSLMQKFGRRVTHVQTLSADTANHLDFFNGRMSPRLLPALLEQAGVPDARVPDSLLTLFSYQTADGYTYVIRMYTDYLCQVYDVLDPDGKRLSDEAIDKLTVKILVQYLALAAALSGVLICLLTVPKAIRKRKAKKLLKQEG